jgi:hypothetical protein
VVASRHYAVPVASSTNLRGSWLLRESDLLVSPIQADQILLLILIVFILLFLVVIVIVIFICSSLDHIFVIPCGVATLASTR